MYSGFERKPDDADVIIIGAGISGMTAAYYILEHDPGINVLILEASDKIGGRTQTNPLKISEKGALRLFDLGGQYVSTSQQQMLNLMQKLELDLTEVPSYEGNVVWNLERGKIETRHGSAGNLSSIKGKRDLVNFFQELNRMSKTVTFDNPHLPMDSELLDYETMETFITRNLKAVDSRNYARTFIRITCGVEPSDVTILFYLAYHNSSIAKEISMAQYDGLKKMCIKVIKTIHEASFQTLGIASWIFLAGGYEASFYLFYLSHGGAEQVCQRIASQVGREFIETSEPVIQISTNPVQVTVETDIETYQCKYTIIAIPPTETLKIMFKPALPFNRSSFQALCKLGHLIKFVVTYKSEFWRNKGLNGEIISCGREGGHGPIQVCCNVSSKTSAVLAGLIASKDCLIIRNESHKAEILHQLSLYFGNEALSPLDYQEKSWCNVPYIDGCFMNNPGVGNMGKYPEMKRPSGRLFWAGTETASLWNGHMNGAVYAGYRAALEMLYDYRPQSLLSEDLKFLCPQEVEIEKESFVQNFTRNWKIWLPITGLIAFLIYRRTKMSTEKM